MHGSHVRAHARVYVQHIYIYRPAAGPELKQVIILVRPADRIQFP